MSLKKPPSCDWKGSATPGSKGSKTPLKGSKTPLVSRLYRHKGNFTWQGVKTDRYKPDAGHWSMVMRRALIGGKGEKTKFHLRYFEVAPGGCTSLERHRHEHVVVGIRGKGLCLAGRKKFEVGFLDTVYIAPDTPHQLKNPFEEPFGFFCMVDAKRDRPKIF